MKGGTGDKERGGDHRVVITPRLVFLFLLTGAGLFLMSRDTPHWLRVSVAFPWNGGKL